MLTANDFVVADYHHLKALKKAFSRAYADALRQHSPLRVVGDPTPKQLAIIRQVLATKDADARRGERSVITTHIKLRGECKLKRHFKSGCLRQIVGYADLLAAKDPERFIWVKDWKHCAKRGRKGEDGHYGDTSIKMCIRALENCGILTPVRRERSSATRTGWIVARHDDVCEKMEIHGRCQLKAIPDFTVSSRRQGERRDRSLSAQVSFQVSLDSSPSVFPSVSRSDPKCLYDDNNLIGEKELEGRVENSDRANPRNPVNNNPENPFGLGFGLGKTLLSSHRDDDSDSNRQVQTDFALPLTSVAATGASVN